MTTAVDDDDWDRSCEHDRHARREYPVGSDAWREAMQWNARNLTAVVCSVHGTAIEVPGRAGSYVRQARLKELVEVRVDSDACGVCLEPLLPGYRWPDRRATTDGHEPPVSRAAPRSTVLVRPEHWGCNLWKSDRTDEELFS